MKWLLSLTLLLALAVPGFAQLSPTVPTHPTQVNLPLSYVNTIVAADGTALPIGPYSLSLNTSGYTVITVCASSCTYNLTQFQSALNAATCTSNGTIIKIAYNASISGSFSVPNLSCGAGKYVVVTTDTSASAPPAGQRINLSYSGNVPKIIASVQSSAVITVADSASNWIFQNVEFDLCSTCSLTDFTTSLIQISDEAQTTTSQIPTNIIFDRVIIHGVANQGLRRGILFDAKNSAVINSYFDEIHETGSDAQDIGSLCTTGILLIDNNYLSASTENFLSGGSSCTLPSVQANQPNDVTFTRNYVFKPESWRVYSGPYTTTSATRSGNVGTIQLSASTRGAQGAGPSSLRVGDIAVIASCSDTNYNGSFPILASPAPDQSGTFSFTLTAGAASTSSCSVTEFHDANYVGTSWLVKNSFEMKEGKRYLLRGNVFQNMWAAAQSGRFITVNALAQDSTVTQAETSDIEFAWNTFNNGFGGFFQFSCNATGIATPVGDTGRHLVHDNLAQVGEESSWIVLYAGDTAGASACLPTDWYTNHNTIITTVSGTGGLAPQYNLFVESAVATAQTPIPNFAFNNNIVSADSEFGVSRSCSVNGVGQACYVANAFYKNIFFDTTGTICSGGASIYATNSVQCPVADITSVGFTNVSLGNYLPTGASIAHIAGTDSRDVGVSSFVNLLAETNGAVVGIWNVPASSQIQGVTLTPGTKIQ